MTRRPTPSEFAWPFGPEDNELAISWASSMTTQVLGWTWRAFDDLKTNLLSCIDWTQPLEQVERDMVRNHFGCIQRIFATETDGFAAFYPSHEEPEMETRSTANAKPPAYDLAFVATANPRWIWPIEAKIVRSPKALAEYMKDVNEKFVAGIAAPFVGEGAMVGYLTSLNATTTLDNISLRLGQPLTTIKDFRNRSHKTSFHSRSNAPDLRLHHMIMTCDD